MRAPARASEADYLDEIDAVGAGCPADEMAIWLSAYGYHTSDASEVPAAWARVSRQTFADRRPDLAPEIWDDIWTAIPFAGDSLWVVATKPEDYVGEILIPDNSKLYHHDGWVLQVGWDLCRPTARGFRCLTSNPLDLIGQRVAWGAYGGEDLGTGRFNPARFDKATGEAIPERNQPKAWQYTLLRIGDIRILSLKEGGKIR